MNIEQFKALCEEKDWTDDPYTIDPQKFRVSVTYRGEVVVFADEPDYTNSEYTRTSHSLSLGDVVAYISSYSHQHDFIVLQRS